MRILAIDYGEKRIGLAVSDELEVTARGIAVVERKSKKADLEAIAAAVSEFGASAIVVRYPLRLDGSAGIQCEKVDRFIAALKGAVSVTVTVWDETLSTTLPAHAHGNLYNAEFGLKDWGMGEETVVGAVDDGAYLLLYGAPDTAITLTVQP